MSSQLMVLWSAEVLVAPENKLRASSWKFPIHWWLILVLSNREFVLVLNIEFMEKPSPDPKWLLSGSNKSWEKERWSKAFVLSGSWSSILTMSLMIAGLTSSWSHNKLVLFMTRVGTWSWWWWWGMSCRGHVNIVWSSLIVKVVWICCCCSLFIITIISCCSIQASWSSLRCLLMSFFLSLVFQ